MAGEKLLTEATCKNAKARIKQYYLNDGGGLRLRIRPDSSRSWLYRFRLNGRESTCSLGTYPQISLQIARVKTREASEQVSKGINPATAKRVAKVAQIILGETTFGAIGKEWLKHNQGGWSAAHYERNEGLLRRYLLPDLGRLPIDSIGEAYLFAVLKKKYDGGAKESSRRARAIASQIFAFARATQRATKNPARDMADNPYFKRPPVKHHEAIPQQDIPKLMERLNQTGENQILDFKTVCALKLALYTGLRDNAIRGAKWNEIDLIKGFWTVPATRMKNRKIHIVPLSQQAIHALTNLKSLTYRSIDSYLFPGTGKYGCMAENTLRLALHRLGFKVTVHGMRTLITNVLNENHFNRDAIERQLDHVEENSIRRAYLTSDFMDIRVPMMQWFANWCDLEVNQQKATNVIALRKIA